MQMNQELFGSRWKLDHVLLWYFYITEDDMMGTPVFSRLKPEEYVLDVTADLHRNNLSYDLVFQRTVWCYPLRSTDNVVYTELMFFQSLPDYIEGLVVVLKDGLLGHRDEVHCTFLYILKYELSGFSPSYVLHFDARINDAFCWSWVVI